MKKTYFVDTNDASVELVLSFLAEQKGYVRVRGYDTNDKETVYFDRRDAINKGKASISIPLPLSPKKLCVEVITQLTLTPSVNVDFITKKALKPVNLVASMQVCSFLAHALDVVKNLNTLKDGVYTDKQKNHPIFVAETLKNRDTGKVLNTPARVSRKNGYVEISKGKMRGYTVAMRVFILCHERSHYELNTSDEVDCDLNALKWYLALGFSQKEALHACTRVFSGEQQIHHDRAAMVADYINNFNAEKGGYFHNFQ